MTLTINDETRDISTSRFAKSYLSGSYVGRFTVSCQKAGKGFSLNFFGVEIAQDGSASTAAGSISYDGPWSIKDDSALTARKNINLYQFNVRRNEYWRQ